MATSASSFAPGELICVTGGSGFIASHIIERLLQRGYRVRAVVRDLAKQHKYQHLKNYPHKDGQLEFVAADIEDGKYPEVFKGAHAVLHLATPYIYTAPDPQRDIVDPAVKGTEVAFHAAVSAGVRRLIVTSSGGAVFHFPVEPGYVYTQKDWSNFTLQTNAYFLSKRLAEQAGWDLYKEHKEKNPDSKFEFAVVNPLFVLGPLSSSEINTSLITLKKYLMGEITEPQPGFVGFVDVRDVADAHIVALEKPKAVGQRLFACNEVRAWKEIAVSLRKQFPEYPVLKLADEPAPKPNFGLDTTPLQELGWTAARSFDQMIFDSVESLIRNGLVPDLRKK